MAGSRLVRHLGYAFPGLVCLRVPQRGWFQRDWCAVTGSLVDGCRLTGLFYGDHSPKVFFAQCIGSVIICGATFAAAMTVFGVLKAAGHLRISRDGEEEGMDLHEHGISAYPEYVISALAAPQGMGRDTVHIPAASDARTMAGSIK